MPPLTRFVEEPPNIPDLGLGYLASSLRNGGHEVFIRDWNMNPSKQDFEEWLLINQPEVIGLKVFTKDVRAAKKTISIIRKTLPKVNVVIGGPHPSALGPIEVMEDFSECDFAVKGEAETSFLALLDSISKNSVQELEGCISKEKAKNIPGLVWREKNTIYSNPITFPSDLDSIDLPAWELLDPNNYQIVMLGSKKKEGSTAPMITTRGCPGKCSFCSAYKINGRKIRFRSPANVFKEMKLLYDLYNVRKFSFQDNCFTSVKKNLTKFCEMVVASGMDIEWDCVSYERLDNLNNETLPLMFRSGCRMIHLGIESGSEKTRKCMNKAGSLKAITEKVQAIKRSGIKVGAWFMIGFPGETKQDMQETVKCAFSLGANLIQFTIVFPLPGTDIYEYLKKKYGFKSIDWSTFSIFQSIYPMSELSSKKITRLLKKIRLRIRIKRKLQRISYLLGIK